MMILLADAEDKLHAEECAHGQSLMRLDEATGLLRDLVRAVERNPRIAGYPALAAAQSFLEAVPDAK